MNTPGERDQVKRSLRVGGRERTGGRWRVGEDSERGEGAAAALRAGLGGIGGRQAERVALTRDCEWRPVRRKQPGATQRGTRTERVRAEDQVRSVERRVRDGLEIQTPLGLLGT